MQIKHFAIALIAALLPALACGQGQNFPGGSSSSASPSESTWYFAQNCGSNPNCTTVKFDANVTQDGSTTSGSNVFTCPNADCKFLTTAKVGQIFFATDNATAPANVTACLNNATITFGGLQQTTISSVDSDTQIHVVGNAGSTSTANACAAWGDDDTTAINNGVNAAPCTANYTFPLGYTLFSLPIIQAVPACPPVASQAAFQGPMVTGQNAVGTFFIPTPGFNFTSIIGGRSTNPASAKAAFGNQNIVQYKDIFIYGIGQRCTATLANTVLLLAGSEARLYNVSGLGWCGQGGGTSLVGVLMAGALDMWEQGGPAFFGSEGLDVEAPQVYLKGNYFAGMTSNTPTVFRCTMVVGEINNAASAMDVNNWHNSCIAVYAGAELTMVHGRVSGNNAGAADGGCLNVAGANAIVNLLSNDQICQSPIPGESAVIFFATGQVVNASRAIFTANGSAPVIVGIAGSTFVDQVPNTFSGGTGTWNGLGFWAGDASASGVVQAAANITPSTGWGTSGAAGNGVSAVSGQTINEQFTITAAGTPAANPTVAIVFPKAFPAQVPTFCVAIQVGGTGAVNPLKTTTGPTVSGVTFTWVGTPVAASTYIINVECSNK